MFFPHSFGLWQSWKCGHSWNVLFSWFLLVNLMVATMTFHGTLQRWGQVYDECCMFMSQAQILNCLMICKKVPSIKRAIACLGLLTSFLTLYAFVGHTAFVIMYGVSSCILAYATFKASTALPAFRNDCVIAMLCGFAFAWFPDRVFCDSKLFGTNVTIQYFGLHGWFHIVCLYTFFEA